MDYIQFLKGLHVQPDELTGKVWIRPEVARAIASELEANHRDIDAIKAERDAANQLIEAAFVKLGWTIPDTPNHETITAVYDSLKAHVQAKYAQYKADAPAPTPPPADTGAGDGETDDLLPPERLKEVWREHDAEDRVPSAPTLPTETRTDAEIIEAFRRDANQVNFVDRTIDAFVRAALRTIDRQHTDIELLTLEVSRLSKALNIVALQVNKTLAEPSFYSTALKEIEAQS
jgi:hypothetical protein